MQGWMNVRESYSRALEQGTLHHPPPHQTSFSAPSFRQSSGDLLSMAMKYGPALMSMANGGGGVGGGGNAAIGNLLASGLGSMLAGGGGGGGGGGGAGLRDGVSHH